MFGRRRRRPGSLRRSASARRRCARASDRVARTRGPRCARRRTGGAPEDPLDAHALPAAPREPDREPDDSRPRSRRRESSTRDRAGRRSRETDGERSHRERRERERTERERPRARDGPLRWDREALVDRPGRELAAQQQPDGDERRAFVEASAADDECDAVGDPSRPSVHGTTAAYARTSAMRRSSPRRRRARRSPASPSPSARARTRTRPRRAHTDSAASAMRARALRIA